MCPFEDSKTNDFFSEAVDELIMVVTTALEGASARVSKAMEEFVGEILESRKALVFGKPVDEVLRRESSNLIVPVVVYKIVAFLSKDGVYLFFIPGVLM